MQSYPSFQLFCVDRPKRLEYVTCGRVFFSKTEGKIVRFQKYPDTCQRGQKTIVAVHLILYSTTYLQYIHISLFKNMWTLVKDA